MQRKYNLPPKIEASPKKQDSFIPSSGTDFGIALWTFIRKEIDKAFDEKVDSAVNEIRMAHTADPPRTYTRKQVCETLKCSATTFANLVRKKAIVTTRCGRSILVYADDFDRKLASDYFASMKWYRKEK